MTTSCETWKKCQSDTQQEWLNANNSLYNNLTLKELIKKSETSNAKDFNVDAELIYGIEINMDFTSDVANHKFKYSRLWIAESVDYPPDIFRFLEAVAFSEEKEIFYFCDEEGPETFLYVKNLGNNLIRFVHISQRGQYGNFVQTEDYKVRLDMLIDKTEFIKTFYSALIDAIKNISQSEIENYRLSQIDTLTDLQNASPIIEEYLKVS